MLVWAFQRGTENTLRQPMRLDSAEQDQATGDRMSQRYEKLRALLKELFQLDQPDLDFGFYRVMHAKSAG